MGRGTMRSMVEGLTSAGVEDVLNDSFGIGLYLSGGYADDPEAVFPKPRVTPKVSSRISAHLVGNAVDLDAELREGAVEIQHIWPCGVLFSKFESLGPCSQELPEPRFCRTHGAAERSCLGYRGFVRLPHLPLHRTPCGPPPHPLRGQGG